MFMLTLKFYYWAVPQHTSSTAQNNPFVIKGGAIDINIEMYLFNLHEFWLFACDQKEDSHRAGHTL